MIRLYMNVMLTEWKQFVKRGFKKEKTASCFSGYSKKKDLKMSFVRIGRFLSDYWIGFFWTWIF
jgi:hypothetical protein